MEIYNYSEITGEYTGTAEAQQDPLESKRQGKFVPLVPANATLTIPPKCGTNKIQVYENEGWAIKPDYRENYKQVDENLTITDITDIGDIEEDKILVTNTVAEDIEANKDWYYIKSGKVVKKTEAEYKEEQAELEAERIATLHMTKWDFFKYVLEPKGITYETLVTATSGTDKLSEAWNLCKDVYRGDEVLTGFIKNYISITDDELDTLFEQYGENS